MPNGIKYSTGTTPSGSLRKGNMLISNNTADTGATFFTGINPPTNGYTIYLNKASGGPSIYCPANDTELVFITNQIAGANYTTAAQCLNYFATQTDKIVVNKNYEGIVTNGLVLNFDAGFTPSYPTTGITWYDISGGSNNGTLTNGPTFNTNGAIVFDGIDDYANSGCDLSWNNTNSISISFWMNPSTVSGGNYGIMGKEYPYWEWAFYQYNTTLNLVYWNTDGGHTNGMDFSVNAFPTANIWYHVVYTWDGSTSIFYVNGVALGSKVATDPSINQNRPNNVMIGGHTYVWTDAYWSGKISNVNFYNRALTQAEVNQNYYQASIVTGSLTHLWDAGNLRSYPETGTTTYNMTSSINGTLQNGVSYTPGNGGYWSFDGVDDRILLDNYNYSFSLGDGNSNWTVNAWVKTTTAANGLGAGSVLSNSNGGPVYSMMGINGGKIVYWVYPSNINNWKGWQGTITVNNGAWHMLTWVNKVGYTMDMYVDGVLDTTISPTNAGNNNPIDIIGGSWSANFQGDISTVQVYQGKAFTASEVGQNFNAQRNRFGF